MEPASLKEAIAVGIGLFIAMAGLQWAGIVVQNPFNMGYLGVRTMVDSLLGKPVERKDLHPLHYDSGWIGVIQHRVNCDDGGVAQGGRFAVAGPSLTFQF